MLYHNRKLIADGGISLFGPKYLRMEGRDLAAMFGLSWTKNPAPRRDPHAQLVFLAKGNDRIVLSEQNFGGSLINPKGRAGLPVYPAGPDRIAELVAKVAPVDVQVFLGVRNPVSFMGSVYSQTLLSGIYLGPKTFRARNDWRKVDWADYVAKVRATAGLGEIFIWRHEDYARAQRLVMRRMLNWAVGGAVDLPDKRVHQGLSVQAVRQTLELAQIGKDGYLASDARKAFPVGDEFKKFVLYAATTIAEATRIYDEQMDRVTKLDGVTVLHPPSKPQKG